MFVRRVVKADVVFNMVDELKSQFGKLCIDVVARIQTDPSQLVKSISDQFNVVENHCKEIRNLDPLVPEREIQLNEWAIPALKKELALLGFTSQVTFPHNDYSLFGKSRPDFAFYKQIGNELTGGMIIESDSLYGSTLEFKKDSSLLKLAQAFANMVRVANDLLLDALKRGKVINAIVVYGLVVYHDEKQCLPMRYICDFSKNYYIIEVGQETEFYQAFSLVALVT